MVNVTPTTQMPAIRKVQAEWLHLLAGFQSFAGHVAQQWAERIGGPRPEVGPDGMEVIVAFAGHRVRLRFVGVRISPDGARSGVVRGERVQDDPDRKAVPLGDFEFLCDGLATLVRADHPPRERPDLYVTDPADALWIAAAYLHESMLAT